MPNNCLSFLEIQIPKSDAPALRTVRHLSEIPNANQGVDSMNSKVIDRPTTQRLAGQPKSFQNPPTFEEVSSLHKSIWHMLEETAQMPDNATKCKRICSKVAQDFPALPLSGDGQDICFDHAAMLVGALECGDATLGQKALLEKVLPMLDQLADWLDFMPNRPKPMKAPEQESEVDAESPPAVTTIPRQMLEDISDRTAAIDSTISMLIVVYGGEIEDAERPAGTIIAGLFESMADNLEQIRAMVGGKSASVDSALKKTQCLASTQNTIMQSFGFENPFSDAVIDGLLGGLRVGLSELETAIEASFKQAIADESEQVDEAQDEDERPTAQRIEIALESAYQLEAIFSTLAKQARTDDLDCDLVKVLTGRGYELSGLVMNSLTDSGCTEKDLEDCLRGPVPA